MNVPLDPVGKRYREEQTRRDHELIRALGADDVGLGDQSVAVVVFQDAQLIKQVEQGSFELIGQALIGIDTGVGKDGLYLALE